AQRAAATLFFVPMGLLAIIAPLLAGVGAGPAGPEQAAISNSLIKLSNVLPLDFAAGAFLGVPMGLNWAASMIDKRVHTHPHPAPARS
ncbi:MAG: hypothetical protein H7Y88_02195, partial [Phycisphaerales bacterium]|nr:hypothetical protein [Phycisphaerales bacterium]